MARRRVGEALIVAGGLVILFAGTASELTDGQFYAVAGAGVVMIFVGVFLS